MIRKCHDSDLYLLEMRQNLVWITERTILGTQLVIELCVGGDGTDLCGALGRNQNPDLTRTNWSGFGPGSKKHRNHRADHPMAMIISAFQRIG